MVRRFGLADALGIVVALVALTYFPWVADPASFPKLLVLSAGGLGLAPAVIDRWSHPNRPRTAALIPCIAAALLLAWCTFATLVADAPWSVKLFGWWLRADGLLAIIAAAVLLLGAATLTRAEVRRTSIWVVAGAAVAALFAIPQFAGTAFLAAEPNTISSTFGQINFAGAYFAMTALLALGLALTPGQRFARIAFEVGALAFAALAILSTSTQGPMALAAGLLVFGLAWALAYRGSWRPWLLGGAAVVLVTALCVSVLGLMSRGPLAFIGTDGNTVARFGLWSSGWSTMNGHPILGIGTGSFARHISEFRSLANTIQFGEPFRPSAAHSIPLQFGIVGGWPALILWFVVFIGAIALILIRVARRPVAHTAATAAVAGALAAYLTQALVSIDAPSIVAIGWLLAGLAIAKAREPEPVDVTAAAAQRPKKTPRTPTAEARSPIWVPVAGILLAVIGGGAVWVQISAVERARDLTTMEAVAAAITDPMVPCPVRLELANSSLKGQPLNFVLPTIAAATALDVRCPPILNLQSDVALEAGNLDLANQSTALGVAIDPQSVTAWNARAAYFEKIGDVAGKESALAEVARINSGAAS